MAKAYYTEDAFTTNQLLFRNAAQCLFGKATPEMLFVNSKSVFCVEYQEANDAWNNEVQVQSLFHSTDYFRRINETIRFPTKSNAMANVMGIGITEKYLTAAVVC
jgi:hypothetical protein